MDMTFKEFCQLEVVENNINNKKEIESEQIETSGSSGGDCWGEESQPYETGREFHGIVHLTDRIDEILLEVSPDLSCLRVINLYKKLNKKVEEREYCDNEYYGNYSQGFKAVLKIQDLYDALKEIV